MKKILFILLLIPALVFGQATGKVIADKPAGGAIGTAATTVDVITLFNLNQTTAGQTLTVPNLTNAAAGKIIYINNVGSVALTLTPGGLILAGKGVVLRWTGAAWSVTGIGSGGVNPTTLYYPINTAGSFVDGHLFEDATHLYFDKANYNFVQASPNTFPYINGSNNMVASTTVLQYADQTAVQSPDGTSQITVTDDAPGIALTAAKTTFQSPVLMGNSHALSSLDGNIRFDFGSGAYLNISTDGETSVTNSIYLDPTEFTVGDADNFISMAPAELRLNNETLLSVISPTITLGDITNTTLNLGRQAASNVFLKGIGLNASTVPYLDANNQVTSSAVTPTQLSYVDATSSIQTQLNNSYDTFTMPFIPTGISPADATTYYFSPSGGASVPTTTATSWTSSAPFNFTVIGAVVVVCNNTVSGSTEDNTLQLRNTTTAASTVIGTFKSNASTTNVVSTTITGLSIAVSANDDFAMQFDSPSYVTNPTSMSIRGYLICKRTN